MEQPIKQRVVGAIILVALAIIVLPLLFDGEGYREFSRIRVEVPERPALVFGQHFSVLEGQSTLGATTGAGDEVTPGGPRSVAPEAAKDASVAPGGTTTEVVPPDRPSTAVVKRPAEKNTDAAPQSGPWVVQAGVFAVRKNAVDLRAKLRKAGFGPVFDKKSENQSGEIVYFVRIGPHASRLVAERVVRRLRRKHDIKAFVMIYDDDG